MKKIIFILLLASIFMTKSLYSEATKDGEIFSCFNNVCLSETTIYEVQKLLGKTKIIEIGETSEYKAFIYYYYKKDNVLIKFYSGELGGETKILVGYELEKRKPNKLPKNCKILEKDINLNIGGIYIGMTKDNFYYILKNAIRDSQDMNRFTFEHTKKVKGIEFDVLITIQGEFKNNILNRVIINKTVTN